MGQRQLDRIIEKFKEAAKTPLSVGLAVTASFTLLSVQYYSWIGQNESQRTRSSFFSAVQTLQMKYSDLRFQWRGPLKNDSPVALVAIDDRSLESVGRWPWSRAKIAKLLDELFQNGAKAVGLDIIFSEPEVCGVDDPDAILAKTIAKYNDKLVLGVFSEDSLSGSLPYQDYCRNEAFRRYNANKFVKLNSSFIVDDTDDSYVELDFEGLFANYFSQTEEIEKSVFIRRRLGKIQDQDLTPMEQARVSVFAYARLLEHCQNWLTKEDIWGQSMQDQLASLLATHPQHAGLSPTESIHRFMKESRSPPIDQRMTWTTNTDEIQAGADYSASFVATQDMDGTLRRMNLFFRSGNKVGLSYIPSLSLQTYLLGEGKQARLTIERDPKYPSQKRISQLLIGQQDEDGNFTEPFSVPLDESGQIKINYFGGRNHFPYVPAFELLSPQDTMMIQQTTLDPKDGKYKTKETLVKKSEFIKDRVFLIGATAIGVFDLRVTPFEKTFPGPEVHVNVLANLIEQNFIGSHPKERFFMTGFLLAVGSAISFFVSILGAVYGFFAAAIAMVLLVIADRFLYFKGTDVQFIIPFFLIICVYFALTFYKYFTEERKKQHLRSTFSKYVSPAIVDEILKDPTNVELGGRKQRMTVFFSDVRGFTTISEKLDPQKLSEVLNEYLTPMTQTVFDNKGTLDKYMGDAVMAFFGAPIFFENHAAEACRCALQSLDKLVLIQESMKAKGLPHIDLGIGINTAEMSVGNMGSNIVRNYTVMGDGVNLGSRLEGLNREYGTRIIISESTYSDVKDAFTAREIDWVRVKGKTQPVKIFELISEGPVPTDKKLWLETFERSYLLFRQKNFAEALAGFQTCSLIPMKDLNGKNAQDPVSALYIERCLEFLKTPPDPAWDGVVTMKTK